MHRSYGLQGSLKRRCKHPSPTSINGYHTAKNGLGAIVYKRLTFAFVGESGYTLGFRRRIAHSGSHGETGGVLGGGWYHYPRSIPHVHKHPRAGYQNGVLCRFGILAGRCSRRTQKAFGTAMRLCVSLSRGVAAPLGCVIFSVSVEIYGFTPRTQGFLCVRGGGGITTPGARCVLLKFSAPACQSGLFAAF